MRMASIHVWMMRPIEKKVHRNDDTFFSPASGHS
jgi:hypothetical protein